VTSLANKINRQVYNGTLIGIHTAVEAISNQWQAKQQVALCYVNICETLETKFNTMRPTYLFNAINVVKTSELKILRFYPDKLTILLHHAINNKIEGMLTKSVDF